MRLRVTPNRQEYPNRGMSAKNTMAWVFDDVILPAQVQLDPGCISTGKKAEHGLLYTAWTGPSISIGYVPVKLRNLS